MQVKVNYNKADLEIAIKYLEREGGYEDVLGMFHNMLNLGVYEVVNTPESFTTRTCKGLHLVFTYEGYEELNDGGLDIPEVTVGIYCSPQLRKMDWMTALVEV
jgi:hypothetical protein